MIERYTFEEKKFKKWTRSRRVGTAGQSMRKEGGSVLVSTNDVHLEVTESVCGKRPKSRVAAVQIVSERHREISKAKDALHLAERVAEMHSDTVGRIDDVSRSNDLHLSRHLISCRADAFFLPSGEVCHAQKSRMLKISEAGGRRRVYTLDSIFHRLKPKNEYPLMYWSVISGRIYLCKWTL